MTRGALSNARFVTIDKRAGSFQPAPKFVQLNQSCSADWTIFARAERRAFSNYRKTVTTTRNFTIQPKLPSAAFTHSF